MPKLLDFENLDAGLREGKVKKIKFLADKKKAVDAAISGPFGEGFQPRVCDCSLRVSGWIDNDTIEIVDRVSYAPAGLFIFNAPDKVIAGAENDVDFFFSDNFGGCDFTFARSADGRVFGSHVYSSEACRNEMNALPGGWTFAGSWKSTGYQRQGSTWAGCNVLPFVFVQADKLSAIILGLRGYPPIIGRAEAIPDLLDADVRQPLV